MRGRPPPRVERTMLRPWDETQEHRDNLEELMYKLRGEDGLGVPYEPEVRCRPLERLPSGPPCPPCT